MMGFGQNVKCSMCGVVHQKTAAHRCFLDNVEDYFIAQIEANLPKWELTPRMKRRLAFEHWCMENNRL